MNHKDRLPAVVAGVIGAAMFGAYVAATGLDADIGHSGALLAMALAIFVVPGCASVLLMEVRARRSAPSAAAVVVAVPAVQAPFPAAEAVADVRSLTHAKVDRRIRERRATARTRGLVAG
ncbi:MAG: hypothetical protein ABI190_02980 [Casimicrobiaceae bacterium]